MDTTSQEGAALPPLTDDERAAICDAWEAANRAKLDAYRAWRDSQDDDQ